MNQMVSQSNWVAALRIMFDHPWLTFFLFMIVVEAIRAVILAIINRKKPVRMICQCHLEDEENNE